MQNVPENSAKTPLPWLHFPYKTDQRSIVKKTKLNSLKDDFLMKSFPSATKRKLSILWNFLFPFFCLLSLKCKTLVLKLLHGDCAAAIVLKMDICHRVSKYAKSGVFYAKIVQMTPPRLRRESLRLQKFSVRNTVLSLPFSQQIQFMLIVNVANLN